MPYNAAASSGSNQGPLNPALADAVKGRVEALRAADPGNQRPVPIDLVTARPAASTRTSARPPPTTRRIVSPAPASSIRQAVRQLIAQHTEGRDLGVFGEPRVHVLRLNLALDVASR
jgi:K+-transporting ATPase ATPase C chain